MKRGLFARRTRGKTEDTEDGKGNHSYHEIIVGLPCGRLRKELSTGDQIKPLKERENFPFFRKPHLSQMPLVARNANQRRVAVIGRRKA
jgi:hypothetical protein